MKTISIILIIILLSACNSATYKVKRCAVTDGIIHCSTAQIKSKREFADGVQVKYKDGEFTFTSGEVSTNQSPLELAGAQALIKIIEQVKIK